MSRARHLSLSVLVLAIGPAFWLACGGGKPPETPADESSSESSSSDTSASPADSSSLPASAGSAAGGDDSSPAPATSSAPAAAAAPPPAAALGDSDCGKCIDKTCAKPLAACSKNTDCQSMVNGVHACSGGAASCIDGATAPTAPKPKKLGAAYAKCAKKAASSKACKATCQ